ncbi:type IV secretory system conjugative DNA transfer family protein [Antarcticirhabdus aurantiaca]|uniref:Type IV secretory system conjugative DNA transfer family protein n=1 Tax=Antarcticirhabdus aurantiaca TaxID=2606717 RepID=A0ACD4NRV5_9HYPH|nr:type IV secretory system conjugative DNA transfer family protein [Antarcticirhabdus aurantiaca]WAJ29448.1 type IV secretory system conjugative DNA transfer family protein [Jeongeuplla avenae]
MADGTNGPGTRRGVIVGREAAGRPSIGFATRPRPEGPGTAVGAPLDGHAIAIAPTGAGKLLSLVVPWTLGWPDEGSVLVVDPKGEAAAVTARARARRGSAVHVVDPFRVSGLRPSPCNPLRFIDPDSEDLLDDARAVAEMMLPERHDVRDAFWRSRALWFVTTAIVHVMRERKPPERTLVSVRDVVFGWARSMRRGEQLPGAAATALKLEGDDPEVRRAAETMELGSPETVGGILHYALEAVGFIRGEPVERSLECGGVDFESFARGDPTTCFLVLPPHLLKTHAPLLRLWSWAFLSSVQRRTRPPAGRTLFVVDEAAQLGHYGPLLTAVTLLRGYGLSTLSLWQDGAQLRSAYPDDWRTMVNNCRTLACFGARTDAGWRDALDTLGMAGCTRSEAEGRILVLSDGRERLLDRIDYRTDPLFEGEFDPNPFHEADAGPIVRPRTKRRKPRRPAARPGGTRRRVDPDLAREYDAVKAQVMALWEPEAVF